MNGDDRGEEEQKRYQSAIVCPHVFDTRDRAATGCDFLAPPDASNFCVFIVSRRCLSACILV